MNFDIQSLHHAYRKYSGLDVKLDFWRESQWREWFRYGMARGGWTEDDLKAVIELRKYRAKNKLSGSNSISFTAIVGSPDLFEESLAEARAHRRKPVKELDKSAVLQSTGRPTEAEKPAQTPAEVMQQHALMSQMLKQWRQENEL